MTKTVIKPIDEITDTKAHYAVNDGQLYQPTPLNPSSTVMLNSYSDLSIMTGVPEDVIDLLGWEAVDNN